MSDMDNDTYRFYTSATTASISTGDVYFDSETSWVSTGLDRCPKCGGSCLVVYKGGAVTHGCIRDPWCTLQLRDLREWDE